jgi:hypothetical protein
VRLFQPHRQAQVEVTLLPLGPCHAGKITNQKNNLVANCTGAFYSAEPYAQGEDPVQLDCLLLMLQGPIHFLRRSPARFLPALHQYLER